DVGIVDHRRKEVDGLNDGDLLGQLVDAGVVVRLGADQEVGIANAWYVTQHLRDVLSGHLARSAGAGGVIDQACAFLATEKQHQQSFLAGRLYPFNLHKNGRRAGAISQAHLPVSRDAESSERSAGAPTRSAPKTPRRG